ncbi:MAG: gamma-glutamyltransferase family protein [Thermoplasmata archaeon]
MRTRPNSFSTKGVVASSSLLASVAGAKVLENGGNVFDASLATSAVLTVTQNNLCGLGGDMFALLRSEGGTIVDVNGSGRAFSGASIQFFRERGLDSIPPRGPYSALTVPGLVSGWIEIHKRCSMELKDLLLPAFTLANDGFPVTHNYSESVEISAKYLAGFEEWRNTFYRDSKPPSPGSVFRQPALANTLRLLMEEGLDSFYRGYVADKILAGLEGLDVPIYLEDLRKHNATLEKPLSTQFFGHTFYETAPNSQGATAILWANMIEEFFQEKGRMPDDSEMIKLGILAYGERDAHITDPLFHPLPSDFTTKNFARKLLTRELDFSASRTGTGGGDTTYFAVADREGNSVSMIQSNYMGFGSGIMPRGMGFVLQNRGSYFTLKEGHHNSISPNKRTFHTLCAAILEKDGRFEASFGTMGGDIQPQIHIQMLMSLVDRLEDPQSVLDRPRWAFPYTIYDKPSRIICESEDLRNSLSGKMKQLQCLNQGFSSEFGHAQIVTLLPNGVVAGAADPRGDGVAIPASPF